MSEHGSSGYPPRLRLLIASALALAIPVVAGAVVSLALRPPSLAEGLAIALFLGLALLAELKPVPLEEDDLSTVSLAFVFILAGVILHLLGETTETRLETRWKDRDGRPTIVEAIHLTGGTIENAAETEVTESDGAI